MSLQLQNDHSNDRKRQAGFTLVEIMVVIVILGILATIVGTNVLGQSEQARVDAAKMEVGSIHEAVTLWMVRNPGRIPEWEDLIEPDERGHAYIEAQSAKEDPWGNVYEIVPHHDYPNKALVISFGPDGQENTEDDIDNENITRNDDDR